MFSLQYPKCILETKDGYICGYIELNEGRIYYRFKKIPYAKPPIGVLRFLPPCPIQPWNEVLNCIENGPLPISYSIKDEIIGSEDCLYIEVCTPNIRPTKAMPVMFWIGSYSYAFSIDNIYDPTLLNDQNVIFVRCGFRLGPFGFLSINDYSAPGNCGLKDLVMALKWVQRNISYFGGDPDNVTIFGNSSGGAIVHFLTLSPMAAGLFHKAIIQSATALNSWSLSKNPALQVIKLAHELGIKKSSKIETVEELRKVPALDIMTAFKHMLMKADKTYNKEIIDPVFRPSIETDREGQRSFILTGPLLLLKSGKFNKVPLLIGSNNIEKAALNLTPADFQMGYESGNEIVNCVVPNLMQREDKMGINMGHQLLMLHLGIEKTIHDDTKSKYAQFISDYYFSYFVNKTIRLHVQSAPDCPVYYYILNYPGEWWLPDDFKFLNSLAHYIDIPFVFRIKTPDICKGSRSSIITRTRIVKMWTNFAKTGNPTPEDDKLLDITWDKVQNEHRLNYLSIGTDLTKGRNPFEERMKIWDRLHEKHRLLRALDHLHDMGVPL